jgi:hypothetical protein
MDLRFTSGLPRMSKLFKGSPDNPGSAQKITNARDFNVQRATSAEPDARCGCEIDGNNKITKDINRATKRGGIAGSASDEAVLPSWRIDLSFLPTHPTCRQLGADGGTEDGKWLHQGECIESGKARGTPRFARGLGEKPT